MKWILNNKYLHCRSKAEKMILQNLIIVWTPMLWSHILEIIKLYIFFYSKYQSGYQLIISIKEWSLWPTAEENKSWHKVDNGEWGRQALQITVPYWNINLYLVLTSLSIAFLFQLNATSKWRHYLISNILWSFKVCWWLWLA